MSGNVCAMLKVAVCANGRLYVLRTKVEGTKESNELDNETSRDLSCECH